MKRVKTKADKPKTIPRDQAAVVSDISYLNIAIMLQVLKLDFGFGEKRLKRVLESHLALMDEVADGRNTINGVVRNSKAMTGIDTKELVNYVYSCQYHAWRKKLGVE